MKQATTLLIGTAGLIGVLLFFKAKEPEVLTQDPAKARVSPSTAEKPEEDKSART